MSTKPTYEELEREVSQLKISNAALVYRASIFALTDKTLREEIARLTGQNSWTGEVDRQGGSFTQEEIENSTAWK